MRSLLDSGAPDHPALVLDDGTIVTYAELAASVDEFARQLARQHKAVVLCRMSRELPAVVGYLAALTAGHCVLPVERATPAAIDDLIATYRPEIVLDGPNIEHAPHSSPIHPDTALLLRTSGSLSRPKLVRLNAASVLANATSIATALKLSPADRAPTTLPLDYSFGLSVLHSHLVAGASLALSSRSPTSARFWPWSAKAGCTSLYAVPTTYQLLAARQWRATDHPHLRSLYQAGGALPPQHIRYFAEQLADTGGTLTVMYGQTEATARISILDPALTLSACGSVGKAIPGGEIWIANQEGAVGEVHYRGPNVMQGYASERADLAKPDELHGVLVTGDLGYVRDGLLHLVGRKDRVVKLLGRRINLADVETAFAGAAPEIAAAWLPPDRIAVVLTGEPAPLAEDRRDAVAAELGLPATMIGLSWIAELPRTTSGKVDYARLRELANTGPSVV